MTTQPLEMITEPEKCTGCGVCRNLCPHHAVRMETDAEGFLSPVIDTQLCTGCGLCRKRCPQNSPPELERAEVPAAYACWNLNDEQRSLSSSGGMFTVYAEQVLDHGGIVFGAGFDAGQNVLFCAARTREELAPLRVSKYVQAETGEVYRRVKESLDSGKEVLFAGTPCQVAALYSFLEADPPNLLTCDIICHGVPSPLFYRKWLAWLEKIYGGPIHSINMRTKKWRTHYMGLELEAGSPLRRHILSWRDKNVEYLGWAFLTNLSLRNRCFSCPYVKTPRMGDLTLGDFWKLGELGDEEGEKRKGISLVLCSSEKGRSLFAAAEKRARVIPREFAEAAAGNSTLREPTPQPAKRDAFVRDTVALDYPSLLRRYRKELGHTRWIRWKVIVKRYLKRLILHK